MKTLSILLFLFLTLCASQAQIPDLTGTWKEFEMTYKTSQGNQVMTENQMKENGSITEYFFMKDGKFRQSSNMSGSGILETYEGTWKVDGNKLVITLEINGQKMDMVWDLNYKDKVMKLSRTSPDGSLTIVNSFRKE